MSRKPANKIAEKNCWNKKMANRKKLDAEFELRRIFDDDKNADRQDKR